ncbi:MAG: hypothetical protein VX281_05210, partial [Pseudomonadota bacterium]|nr:hypothetical protein [Pseudomonadota bacterium]
PQLTFSGVSVLKPELWASASAGAYPLAPMLREAMTTDRLAGQLMNGRWVDVGTPERLKTLENDLLNQDGGDD